MTLLVTGRSRRYGYAPDYFSFSGPSMTSMVVDSRAGGSTFPRFGGLAAQTLRQAGFLGFQPATPGSQVQIRAKVVCGAGGSNGAAADTPEAPEAEGPPMRLRCLKAGEKSFFWTLTPYGSGGTENS